MNKMFPSPTLVKWSPIADRNFENDIQNGLNFLDKCIPKDFDDLLEINVWNNWKELLFTLQLSMTV